MTEEFTTSGQNTGFQEGGIDSPMPLLHLGRITNEELQLYVISASALTEGGLGKIKIETEPLERQIKPIVVNAQDHIAIEVRGQGDTFMIPRLFQVVNFLKAMRHHNAVQAGKSAEETEAALRDHANRKVSAIKEEQAWLDANSS